MCERALAMVWDGSVQSFECSGVVWQVGALGSAVSTMKARITGQSLVIAGCR